MPIRVGFEKIREKPGTEKPGKPGTDRTFSDIFCLICAKVGLSPCRQHSFPPVIFTGETTYNSLHFGSSPPQPTNTPAPPPFQLLQHQPVPSLARSAPVSAPTRTEQVHLRSPPSDPTILRVACGDSLSLLRITDHRLRTTLSSPWLFDRSQLVSYESPITNSFPYHTSKKFTRNPFACHTYDTPGA